jgi:hypothetical protein
MAEMTTLTAAIYRKYRTSLASGFEHATPGITARFEMFYDERFPVIKVSLSKTEGHLRKLSTLHRNIHVSSGLRRSE